VHGRSVKTEPDTRAPVMIRVSRRAILSYLGFWFSCHQLENLVDYTWGISIGKHRMQDLHARGHGHGTSRCER
jgi:hypothetical protein